MASLRRPVALIALLAFVLPAACIDGPFAHANPFDPSSGLELTIVGGPDTIRVPNVVAFYQLVTVPVVNGYRAIWVSSAPTLFRSLEDGRFVLSGVPSTNTPVQIRAYFASGQEAVRNLVVLGATP